MVNRFLISHLQGRGTITRSQEKLLISYPPPILAEHRAKLGIFAPIPKLSKRAAWLLIRAIMAAQQARQ